METAAAAGLSEPLLRAAGVGLAYLLGAIPFGLLVTRLATGRDVREVGSGNIGATNVARAAGRWAALVTLALDAAKGFLPTWLFDRLVVEAAGSDAASLAPWAAAAGLAAIVGHVAPVFLRFRGGKGVATALGVTVVLAWPAALAGAATWGLAFALTRTSSVGSLLAAAVALIVAALVAPHPAYAWAVGAAVALIALRHAGNVKRLLARTEARF